MPLHPDYHPSTAHAELGDGFYDVVAAARFPAQTLRYRNQPWDARIGLDTLSDAEWLAHFAAFAPLPGGFPQPLALRYHGHQFRHYNPDLGDGRGFLFAQLHDLEDGRLLDLGTKGSGTTPWSRGGDGRLTLKGGVREILATAMLEALGVETSKSLSLVETGEELVRGDEPSPTRSAVLVRLNHSHIRIGSFQRLDYLAETARIEHLMDHTIRHYMPNLWRDDISARTVAFLAEVSARVARMGAQWMAAGFVHGVLNTDNINVTGESFDYGPWRFLSTYQPEFTAAYFDHGGLYAYGRQPETLLWNLARLAGTLLPFAAKADLEAALDPFSAQFHTAFAQAVLRRLGLQPKATPEDAALAQAFFAFLHKSQVPFEQAFFDWFGGAASAARAARSSQASAYAGASFAPVQAAFASYAGTTPTHRYFAGASPCTMLVDEVEAIWAPIAADDDWSRFHTKLEAIADLGDAMKKAGAA